MEPDLRVPMRDGIRLAADLYRPDGRTGELPAILIRTQYGKDPYRPPDSRDAAALTFAAQGYAVVVQDLRGRFDSEGVYELGADDAADGYDTLSWVASQPWSNQRVGTYGCSSLGITQVLLAPLCHPAHTCAIAQGSGGATGSAGNRHRLWDFRLGGACEIGACVPWFFESGTKDHSSPQPKTDSEYATACSTLPVIEIMKELGSAPTDYENWMSRDPADPYFDRMGFLREDSVVDTPTLFVNSWYDVGAADALHQHRVFSLGAKSASARHHQHIILSPARHCSTEALESPTIIGGRNLGDARIDTWGIYLRWFDGWLNDQAESIEALPRIQYYTMGRNEWRTADNWPPPSVEPRRFYLHSGGGARTRLGDGTLDFQPPGADEPADSYVYDPFDPTPSVGAQSGGPEVWLAAGPSNDVSDEIHDGFRHVEGREDVLCYTSGSLAQGLEITGFVKAVLYVSSSAPDTDLIVKLLDVDPDGRAFDLVTGVLRVRYRDGFDRPEMMIPGDVYRLEIDLDATSNWFAPGHRVRLQIASSSFPRFDRNLNTGGNNYDEVDGESAHNTVHHCSRYPSHVLLPVSES